jgi:hypothetical protein
MLAKRSDLLPMLPNIAEANTDACEDAALLVAPLRIFDISVILSVIAQRDLTHFVRSTHAILCADN